MYIITHTFLLMSLITADDKCILKLDYGREPVITQVKIMESGQISVDSTVNALTLSVRFIIDKEDIALIKNAIKEMDKMKTPEKIGDIVPSETVRQLEIPAVGIKTKVFRLHSGVNTAEERLHKQRFLSVWNLVASQIRTQLANIIGESSIIN